MYSDLKKQGRISKKYKKKVKVLPYAYLIFMDHTLFHEEMYDFKR